MCSILIRKDMQGCWRKLSLGCQSQWGLCELLLDSTKLCSQYCGTTSIGPHFNSPTHIEAAMLRCDDVDACIVAAVCSLTNFQFPIEKLSPRHKNMEGKKGPKKTVYVDMCLLMHNHISPLDPNNGATSRSRTFLLPLQSCLNSSSRRESPGSCPALSCSLVCWGREGRAGREILSWQPRLRWQPRGKKSGSGTQL